MSNVYCLMSNVYCLKSIVLFKKIKEMLRLIKHHLTGILGVEIFPMISLILFTAFFAFVLYRVIRMRKTYVQELSNLPLDLENENSVN
jgi:cytochrome c oxidase cbb3-type subunit 4